MIPKNKFFFEVGKTLGILPLIKILFIGFFYNLGILSLKKGLKQVFRIYRGIKIVLLKEKFDEISLLSDTEEVFNGLKTRGYKIALVSSGLPTFLVKTLASRLNADYAIGVEIGLKENALTGEIWGDVIEHNGKLIVLKQILNAEGYKTEETIVIADDRNNVSIFLGDIQKIGFNADFIIKIKADMILTGTLKKLLPILDGKKRDKRIPSKKDLIREVIHGSGIFVPFISICMGKSFVALLIIFVIILYTFSEFLRIRGKNLPIITSITRFAASPSELSEFALAPIFFATGILLTLILFSAPASSAAIAIFAIGDSTASIIGGTISKDPVPFNSTKTFEGSIVGFVFAFLAGLLFVSPTVALIGAFVAMGIEFLPLPINDNLLMPVGTGLALSLLI